MKSIAILLWFASLCCFCGAKDLTYLGMQNVFACGFTTKKEYECHEYSPLPIPHAPNDSWFGRLHAASSDEADCLTDASWQAATIAECGAAPSFYMLGASCGESDKYIEAVFTCNRTKKELFNGGNELDAEREEKYLARRYEILDELAKLGIQMDKVKNGKNRTREEIGQEMAIPYMKAYHLVGDLKDNCENTARISIPKVQRHSYITQDNCMATVYWSVYDSNNVRSRALLDIAIQRLMSPNQRATHRRSYDRYDVDGLYLKQLLDSTEAFPELKPQITDIFFKDMKANTLGVAVKNLNFLEKPGAHRRLFRLYDEIFTFGHFDRKYL